MSWVVSGVSSCTKCPDLGAGVVAIVVSIVERAKRANCDIWWRQKANAE
jgi:hypothetical protein